MNLFPLFPNSVVSNEIDFIAEDDPSAFQSLSFLGRSRQEMPENPATDLFQDDVYVFEMAFSDGARVRIFADARFDSVAAAQEEVAHFAGPLGKLPSFMRVELSHVVLNIADHGAKAEADANFMMVSTENMAIRRANNDMEETIFHEAVHASLDNTVGSSEAWRAAQESDGAFITEYAGEIPNQEDLAESALFAHTYI